MALEDLTGPSKFIDAFVAGNPVSNDDRREGDDHIRGIKNVLRNTFPGLNGAVTATDEQMNAAAAVAGGVFPGVPVSGITNLTVTGNASVGGTLAVAGNVTLGDAVGDTLNVGAGAIVKDAAGRVGIGRAPTSFALEVAGTAAVVNGDLLISTGAGGDAKLGYQAYAANGAFNLWSPSNTPLAFGVGGAERVRIDAAGAVGIGAPSPSPRLHVTTGHADIAAFDTSNFTGGWVQFSASGATYGYIGTGNSLVGGGALTDFALRTQTNILFSVGAAERMRIPATGAVTESQGGVAYVMAIDPGANAAAVPVGAIVFAQAVGVTGGALNGLGTSVLGGAASLTVQAFTGGAGASITAGTWRNIGAQTATGVGMWMRVA